MDVTPDDAAALGAPVPVLRMHHEALAREFYLDYLGFGVEWAHRFEPDLPLYLRIRRGNAVLDLSEHHGDGTPGRWSGSPSPAPRPSTPTSGGAHILVSDLPSTTMRRADRRSR